MTDSDIGEVAPGATSHGRSASQHTVTRLAATVERLRKEVQHAQATADGRALIEMAKGVLIERLRCGPAHAARQLDILSGQAGVTPLELAADLVNQAAQDEVSAAVGQFLLNTATPGEPTTAVRLRTAESGLLAAGDTQRVAESVLEHAVAPLGATAVAIWAAGTDASLSLVGFAGIGAHEAERWRYVPPGLATPARQALVNRDAEWIENLSTAGLPSIGDRNGGRAAIPVGAGGKLLGVLEVCWPHPIEPQPPQVRRQLEALAELCAHTLESDLAAVRASDRPDIADLVRLADGLFDPALVLLPHLDDEGALADFRIHHVNPCFVDPAGRASGLIRGTLLLETYPMAASEGRLFERIEHVFATGETYRAERMMLTELVDQVPLTVSAALSISRHGDTVLMVWRVEDEAARLAALLQHAQRLGRVGGFEENAATGEITWSDQLFALYGLATTADPIPLAQLPGHVDDADTDAVRRFLRTLLRYRRPASTAFRLIRPDGVTRHIRISAEPVPDAAGHLLAIRGVYQDISSQHWTEIALSATRDRLTHTEEQAAEQSRLARQLQQAIMPDAQPSTEAFGLRIAVRYQPTEQDHLVGGDWYDAIVLPSKKILLSVGDITGHGITAATGMVVLRNALRGLAATGAGPGQMLTWLNLVAHHLTDSIFATAICGLYDPQTQVLRWARAGHLPPVLIRAGRASTLPVIKGMILGAVAEATYEEAELQLEPNDTLLLYTDGLIERRDRPLDDCVEQLLTISAEFTGNLDERLDHLLDSSDADTDDDTCVVGIEVGQGSERDGNR
ncbi:Serine phosphatase RsbU, regulator of sigma subunit [Nocardia amikacinitolerans]|uniref:Serine phosphatase RsbU, regulator of sigma subunit n=1 Tax=Nocardia amikacinitolerans TaxID=756689 RepID=A0A285LL29_9NOCA|nr:SpoIIE family protein phosphatase [Nocardia amikacinitolerans]MCP2298512.1 Serine phosphatase RsbU, regulator of sigma subunit [Nocardia amikacinitolerans]SNY85608.1 Serine phosphatase RsbU, regulator of sigma subunit [Nocardia amikacinitolerans]